MIAHRASTSNTPSVGSPLTLSVPAGTLDNDLMIAVVNATPAAGAITSPAGWTRVLTVATPNGGQLVVDRRLASSEPASYQWTSAEFMNGSIDSFDGVHTGSPLEGTAASATGTDSTAEFPSITTINANAWHLAIVNDDADATWSTPASYTDRAVTSNKENFSRAIAVAGLVSGVVSSRTGGTGWTACSIAIRPDTAVDPAMPENVIFMWPSTNGSIPAGFTRETSLDARFVKLIPTAATNPGGTGGAATHNHNANGGAVHDHAVASHAHTWPTSTSNQHIVTTGPGAVSYEGAAATHAHAASDGGHSAISNYGTGGATTWDNVNLDPAHLVVIFIKSDGTPTGIPNSALAFMNAVAPAGFAEYVNARDRLLKGAAAAGDGGSTAGADSHTHTLPSHTHARPGSTAHTHTITWATHDEANVTGASGAQDNGITGSHSHISATSSSDSFAAGTVGNATDVSGSGDMVPPWKKLLVVQNTSGAASKPNNIIGLWLGTIATIPSGWKLCDGTLSTPNMVTGEFPRGANGSAQNLTTGGAATHGHASGSHSHADSTGHTHTTANPGAGTGSTQLTSNDVDQQVMNNGADHTASGSSGSAGPTATSAQTITVASNTSNDPTFTQVAFIQFQAVAPTVTTINSPVDGVAYSTTLTVDATLVDTDGGDTITGEFEYSANGGGSWTVIGDGTTITTGNKSTRSWDISGLTPGFTYRVRVRARDSFGLLSGYTSTGNFIIGPGFASIHAEKNTALFSPTNNTSFYFAERNTAEYVAEKD